jgi:hypothetical protein
VKELKSGPYFEERLLFHDGARHKFAHSVCAYDDGIRPSELSMEFCTLPGCNDNFKCSRNSDRVDHDGLYLPGDDPEWGCEPEGCLLVERGYFKTMKGGRFLSFVVEQRGAVHWACAESEWRWPALFVRPDKTNGATNRVWGPW